MGAGFPLPSKIPSRKSKEVSAPEGLDEAAPGEVVCDPPGADDGAEAGVLLGEGLDAGVLGAEAPPGWLELVLVFIGRLPEVGSSHPWL